MQVEIISPDATLFQGEVSSVTVPSQMGSFTLLENHAAIVAILEAGNISITATNGDQKQFAVKGGFVENHNNQLSICVEQ